MTVVVLVALAAAGAYVWHCHLDTYRLATVHPGVLYRDGLQSPCQFETALRKVRPRTVVSLVSAEEQAGAQRRQSEVEVSVLEKRGIHFEHVPLPAAGWPTRQDVDRFLAIVSDPANQPVLVHDADGVRRTGVMSAAYQMKVMGYDKAAAKAQVLAFGEGPEAVAVVHRFIEVYDPATGAVPQNLMPLRVPAGQ